jgi:hypothetical protein
MPLNNEQVVRQAYQIAENKDLEGWVAAFTDQRSLSTDRRKVGMPTDSLNYYRYYLDLSTEMT